MRLLRSRSFCRSRLPNGQSPNNLKNYALSARRIERRCLTFAIIRSDCKRLTWSKMKSNNRDTCQPSFYLSFDSFGS
jgi:hypothetical protein